MFDFIVYNKVLFSFGVGFEIVGVWGGRRDFFRGGVFVLVRWGYRVLFV